MVANATAQKKKTTASKPANCLIISSRIRNLLKVLQSLLERDASFVKRDPISKEFFFRKPKTEMLTG